MVDKNGAKEVRFVCIASKQVALLCCTIFKLLFFLLQSLYLKINFFFKRVEEKNSAKIIISPNFIAKKHNQMYIIFAAQQNDRGY